MHRDKSSGKTFRRLVLVNEDAYKSALQCMEEGAVARMADRTLWYEKSGDRGNVTRDHSFRGTASAELQSPSHVEPAPSPSPAAASMPSTGTAIRPLPEVESVRDHVEAMEVASDVAIEEVRMPTVNRKDVPSNHLKKYDALFKRLRQSEQFRIDSAGRVVLEGNSPIEGSNFHKLLRSMFVSSFASDRTPGRLEFLSALKRFGIRPTEVSSPSARATLSVQGGSGTVKRREGPPGRRVHILRVY